MNSPPKSPVFRLQKCRISLGRPLSFVDVHGRPTRGVSSGSGSSAVDKGAAAAADVIPGSQDLDADASAHIFSPTREDAFDFSVSDISESLAGVAESPLEASFDTSLDASIADTSFSSYTTSTSAAPTSAPTTSHSSFAMSVSPEPAAPAAPEEREANGLPPKSYAEAAEEAISTPEPRHATPNGHRSMNGDHADPDQRDALNLPPKSYAEAAEEAISDSRPNSTNAHRTTNAENTQVNGRVRMLWEEDSTQYEGTGKDDTPKSPTRYGHKRKSSLRSNGSIGRKHGEDLNIEVYSQHPNGNAKPLTSVKPPKEMEKSTPKPDIPASMRKRESNSKLMSGRQAGAGWQKSKIRWAPLNVPLQRRLQTLAVLMHTLSIAGLLTIFFFLCSIPLLWPILLPYLIFVLFSNAGTDGKLSYRSERCRRLPVWSLFASYFPARLHRTQTLEPTRKYIFGYHPHGIISHGAFAAFATEALGFSQLFPGITNTLLTLDSNFRLPLYREYALRMGLASVSRESITNILTKGGRNGEGMGRAVTIVVGGARESLESTPGSLRLILHRRKGFIKMAIRTGADLVPVLCFGENEIYQQVDAKTHPYLHRFQLLVKKVAGFTVPLFHARGVFNYDVGMMPYRRPMNIVVGRPIRVCQEEHPKDAYVDQIHEEYTQELLRIWDDWKDTFAKQRTSELEIIE